jgi:2-hydroxychromene-2-carboxylate isomerase
MPDGPVFYFGAMSPYSWLAAERIGELIPDAAWRCVYLPAIFRVRGNTTWGLTDRREAEMAECEARARARGLGAIAWPPSWPTSDLLAARAIAFAQERGTEVQLALELMRMSFTEGRDISELPAVEEAGRRTGLDETELAAALVSQDVKEALRAQTDGAIAVGVVGVPTVAIGDQLFWGDDRLEEAVANATS